MIHLVLLSGGSGTRLWPLSNDTRSKQFLKVLRDEQGNHVSMVQRTFAQIRHVSTDLDITIVTCPNQEQSIKAQVKESYSLVIEPERRDTAPAIMLACAHLAMQQGASLEDPVIVMPIDTYADQEYYDRIPSLSDAVRSDIADIVLLGVEPACPSDKYGYIIPEESEETPCKVSRFTEKPSKATAAELIERGALWNCGVFAFRLGWLESLRKNYIDEDSFDDICSRYSDLPKNSFDYEVVERATSIAVVSYAGAWKDLGTWNTLTEEMVEACSGRVVMDKSTCEDVHVVNETGFPLVVAGLRNSVVVATPDGILVSSKSASEGIKRQVAQAAESRPMYERRRWGEYRVIDASVYPDGTKAITKELGIEKGRQISYQIHAHRSEVWTVVSGEGEVVLDGLVRQVNVGSVVNVGVGELHAVRAKGSDLRIIEVQLGDILDEEDIKRFGDWWSDDDR